MATSGASWGVAGAFAGTSTWLKPVGRERRAMGDKSELRLTLETDGTPSSPASDLARTEGVRDDMEALDLVNV